MKQFPWLCLLLLPLISGCSWMAEMMLFNKSVHPAAVTFRLDDVYAHQEKYVVKAYTIKKWNDSVPVLGDTIIVYSRINTDGSIYVELPSNTALVLTQGVNDDMGSLSGRKGLLMHVKSLEVMYPNDNSFSCRDTMCMSETVVVGKARAGIVVGD